MINKIVIVGGGSAGWMSAATLIKAFPNKNIQVIEPKNIPTVGVGESTLGFIRRWTDFVEIDESDFMQYTDASYKLSIKFTDFYKNDFGSFHYPFGTPVVNDSNPLYMWNLKKYLYPETSTTDLVNCLFPASYLFENNKFSENSDGKFDNFNINTDVAYHFDATKFGSWLKNRYCIPRGVSLLNLEVKDVILCEKGIDYLVLENDEKVYADLFIDCTGFKGLLISKYLNENFISYSHMLPNNKAWATRVSYIDKEKELEGFTNCTAIENGWCWNIPLWSRLGCGYVYSDEFISDEEAKEEFKQYLMSDKMVIPRSKEEVDKLEFKNIEMRVGIHERTFVKNVVAIGLSAGFIEPLESNGLFSVHEFLFKLVDILQRNDISQFDRDIYNGSVKGLFEGFAKFVAMHYALSHRDDSKYWQKIKNKKFMLHNDEIMDIYKNKISGFDDLGHRYMELWGHPPGDSGLPYIVAGMQMFMMNESRYKRHSIFANNKLSESLKMQNEIWNTKKEQWKNAADESLSLYQYLNKRFYNN